MRVFPYVIRGEGQKGYSPTAVERCLGELGVPVLQGATWTADAPFRETEQAIDVMRRRSLLAVEMEAALYAFAVACNRRLLCLARVTNQRGRIEGDFGKGEGGGSADALAMVVWMARRLMQGTRPAPDRSNSRSPQQKARPGRGGLFSSRAGRRLSGRRAIP